MASSPGRRRWRRRAIGVGAVVVIGGGAAVAAIDTGGPSGYREATAAVGSFGADLDVAGTVATVRSDVASFQVSGTVTGVYVRVGEKVAAGQLLAAVDTSTLRATVQSDRSRLAEAQAVLAENEDDEAAGTGAASGSTPSGSSSTAAATTAATVSGTATAVDDAVTVSRPGRPGTGGTGGTSLSGDQRAVVAAQGALDSAAASASVALQAARSACASAASGSGAPTASTTTTTAPSSTTTTSVAPSTTTTTVAPSTTTTTTSTTTPSASSTAGCSAALGAALEAQQGEQTAADALQKAESALAAVLASSASSSSRSSTSTTSPSRSRSTSASTGSSGSRSTGSRSTGSGSSISGGSSTSGGSSSVSTGAAAADSVEQLASDQAGIDGDRSTLLAAEEDLAAARLVSPTGGTVAQVEVASGDTVSSGDTASGIAVIDTGSYQASVSLTTAQAEQVHVGDTATVAVDGSSTSRRGVVTRVGPASDDDGTWTYPLLVSVDAPAGAIPSGSDAEIAVQLDHVSDALTVPTSALHRSGSRTWVDVVSAGHAVERTVRIGVVGLTSTQVLSGLRAGDVVSLADLADKVPTSSADSTASEGRTFAGGGTGGFSGAARGAGGSGPPGGG